MIDYLKKLPEGKCEFYFPGLRKKHLDSLEKKFHLKLPDDYREVLLYTNGLALFGKHRDLNMFDFDGLNNVNLDELYSEYLPGVFIFGDDSKGGLFFFDIKNKMGKGINSIFLVPTGELYFDVAEFIGSSLYDTIEKVLNGLEYLKNN